MTTSSAKDMAWANSLHPRTHAEVERFFIGLRIVPPSEGAAAKVCYIGEWGAEDPDGADSDGSRWGHCAVAREAG